MRLNDQSSDWASVTGRLLAALREYEAPAIGFVNEQKLYVDGRIASNRVALLAAWLSAGHELGNHTFAHRSAHATSLDEYLEGIERGETVTRPLSRRAGRPVPTASRWANVFPADGGRNATEDRDMLSVRGEGVAQSLPPLVDSGPRVRLRSAT